MIRYIAGSIIILALANCPPIPTPTPTPTPTPSPTVPPTGIPVAPEKLLRQESLKLHLNDEAKTSFEVVQYIPCCMDFSVSTKKVAKIPKPKVFRVNGISQPTLWPLVSPEFIDYTLKRGAANFYHRRFGPFYSDAEPEWESVGGPLLEDGTPNQKFWDKNREITFAGIAGNYYFEDVPLDPWGFKYSQQGNRYISISAEAIAAFGHTWHPEHDSYLHLYVRMMGCFGNNIIALDNEGELIPNYNPEFYRTMLSRYRVFEKEVGCNFVHMVGTSVHELFGEVDYSITHNRSPLLNSIAGFWTINNEHNPNFPPEQEASYFNQARSKHLAWALWRSEASDDDYNKVMDLVKIIVNNGDPSVGCYAPPNEPEEYWSNASAPGIPTYPPSVRSTQLAVEFAIAKNRVGDRCGALGTDGTVFSGCLETNALIAAELRKQNICSSAPWGDATVAKSPTDGKYEEWHVCSYGNGCYTGNPYKGAWDYLPESASSCPVDVQNVTDITCKMHVPVNTYDCTPKINGLPVLPEGDPNRYPCELKAMGGIPPKYSLSGPSGLALVTLSNPMQFKIIGSGTGNVSCMVPVGGPFCNIQVTK